jgi:hypothetical protein
VASQSAVVMDIFIAIAPSMITASFDRRRTKNIVEIASIWLFIYPFSNGVKHVAMNLNMFIAKGWMVENTEDIGHYLININTRVLPGV